MNETETTELTAEQVEALTADAPSPVRGGEFIPTDTAGVDWVLGKMADARARAQRIRENAEKMARAEERNAEYLDWKYSTALQAYVRQELAGCKKKSIRLFNGVVGFRTKPAGVNITDASAAGQWAREFCPDALVTNLDRKALGAALLETGEAVDFADFTPAEDVFYIK